MYEIYEGNPRDKLYSQYVLKTTEISGDDFFNEPRKRTLLKKVSY